MTRNKGLLALATVLVLSLSACGGGNEKPRPAGTGDGPVKGGTLTVFNNTDFTHLDPARNWTMRDMGFGIRLLYRTLTTFKAGTSEVVPDLATDLGRPSEGGKIWTFTLKDGVKYEDGTPVKAQDIKYNVERSFAPELTGGPDYARKYLVSDKYEGPLAGKHLDSIETPDDKTIIFHLKRPVAEFSETVTLPTFAPVPQPKEAGVKYDDRPFSSGPYKIEKYQRKVELVLVRNEHWDPATDPVRKALPDRIVVNMSVGGAARDTRLIADQGPDRSAIGYTDVALSVLPKILTNPRAQQRMSSMVDGCTGLIYLNTSKPPFDNQKVRMAAQYAVDKTALQTADGGPQVATVVGAILPPGLTGGVQRDILRIPPTGDVEKAKALLAEAGVQPPVKIRMATSTGGKAKAEALQAGLKRAGFDLQIDLVDVSAVGGINGTPAKMPELQFGGWCPDYPSGSTFLPMITDSRLISEGYHGGNAALLKDPAIDKKIDEIDSMTDANAANKAWLGLEEQVMATGAYIPITLVKQNNLYGSNVAGVKGNPIWEGNPDFAEIGLKDPNLSK
ncbi:ABC transporter substrate-binding protein [Nonomuraea sediminis]|uniref:ABC transporter substrate-binding protein n=1 Tax=Nonomuraea sediminis TaxID=2835864 RepID=UPI001BDCC93E|nr:ABC transporter substrate-binding protein [Nonomuraea sediminis]